MRNKFSSIVLSVLVAFGLWLYVITTVSPGYEDTFYNIDVIQEGITLLEERNLMLTYQSSSRVAVSCSGNRTDVSKLDSGNITVKLDLSKVYEAGTSIPLQYTVSYPGDVPNGAVTTTRKIPDTIYVTVEERREKPIPVEVVWIGATPEGFMSDRANAVLDYEEITIIGPASVADLIEKAVIEVDLTDRKDSFQESFRYTLCDADGNGVDAQMIKTNVEEVQLQVSIRRIQELQLRVEVLYGGGADASHTSVTLDVPAIQVSGSEAALEALGDVITVGKINIADLMGNDEIPMTVRLPEGITNESGITEVVASVRFNGLETRKITVRNIVPVNLPEGTQADVITQQLTVMVRGPKKLVNQLTEEDVYAEVDLSDGVIGESMKIDATIRFTENYQGLGAVGVYNVGVTIREVEES